MTAMEKDALVQKGSTTSKIGGEVSERRGRKRKENKRGK